ncbi:MULTISPECIES: hypothetical protein [unclassified Brevundimonas]|uniref:hypothetical protein n=1 Tax=unclassified Brevundimonas TaxID=2622653 RepID=UPI0025BA803F|nr:MULTISPECIES: hypothetical protein [unclassified Brevundimonas]
MIEQAGHLEGFLPLSYRTPKEREYVRFLWEAFETNVEHGKYQFAFLAYHMLVMSFVYFNIWQIRQIRPEAFATALIGFGKDMEKDLLEATSPFTFHVVNESHVMRFLKLIQCDNGKIGAYTKLVKDRNETAHSNGNIFFSTEAELATKVREIIRAVAEIQDHSKDIILEGYRTFLTESADPETREHIEIEDQVREVLIHGGYMSLIDLSFCADFDITALAENSNFVEIEALHAEVRNWVNRDDAIAA